MQDTITIAGGASTAASFSGATNYCVCGGKLPTGSTVVKVILGGVATITGNSGGCLIVGDEGDTDRYIYPWSADYTCMATGNAVIVGPNVTTGMNYQVTGITDNYIRVSLAETGANISAGTLKVSIFYTAE